MFRMISLILVLGCLLSLTAEDAPRRMLGLHGSLTEILACLVDQQEIVGADQTALWPSQVRQLPQVGPHRMLSLEGVMSLRSEIILYCQNCGPEPIIDRLKAVKQPLHYVPQPDSLQGVPDRIRTVGSIVQQENAAEALAQAVAADIQAAENVAAEKQGALFVFQMQADTIFLAGAGTAGAQVLEHVGLRNLNQERQPWLAPEPESLLVMRPEVLVVAGSLLSNPDTLASLLARPGIAQSPAVRNGRVYLVDSMAVLGFGPRVGRELLNLARRLNPDADLPESQSSPLLEGVAEKWAQ